MMVQGWKHFASLLWSCWIETKWKATENKRLVTQRLWSQLEKPLWYGPQTRSSVDQAYGLWCNTHTEDVLSKVKHTFSNPSYVGIWRTPPTLLILSIIYKVGLIYVRQFYTTTKIGDTLQLYIHTRQRGRAGLSSIQTIWNAKVDTISCTLDETRPPDWVKITGSKARNLDSLLTHRLTYLNMKCANSSSLSDTFKAHSALARWPFQTVALLNSSAWLAIVFWLSTQFCYGRAPCSNIKKL